jgi:hypothetical protein
MHTKVMIFSANEEFFSKDENDLIRSDYVSGCQEVILLLNIYSFAQRACFSIKKTQYIYLIQGGDSSLSDAVVTAGFLLRRSATDLIFDCL